MKTNWLEVKEQYITSDVSLKELANEFSLSESSLRKRAATENWKEERNKHYTKVEQKTEEKTTEKIAELRSEDYKKFMELASVAENEVVEKALNYIRLLDKDSPEGTSLLQKNQKTIESAVATMERIHYPAHEDKPDNNITVVLSDDKMKEYFK